MKKIAALILLAFASVAIAGPNDVIIGQRNATDSATISRVLPTASVDSIVYYSIGTGQPAYMTLGSGLSLTSGVLSASGGASQVNSDWNAVSGVAQIYNKPLLAPVATTGEYPDLFNKPDLSIYALQSTTLAGYGIVDAYPLSGNPSGFLTGITSLQVTNALGYTPATQAALASKFNTPTGTTAQYVRGDGSLATLPSPGTGTVTSVALTSSNLTVTGSPVTTSGTLTVALPNTGTAGGYSGVTTDAQGRVTAGTNRSFNYTTRALNTCFQISASRDALVTYAVDIQTSLSLVAGQVGTVYLRTYTNNTCTTGTQELTRFVNGQTGALTIGLALTQNVTATLTGVVPAGLWAQLVSENTTGAPTFTARPGQEVQL